MIDNYLLNRRRNWKGMVHSYDALIVSPVDNSECLYCLTIPQTQALIMLAEQLSWITRWIGSDIDQEEIRKFSTDIVERLMMGCCPDGTEITLYRTTENDELQISVDGGETWVQDPDDPRVNVPTMPAPVDSGAAADTCGAASNALAQWKTIVAAISGVLAVGFDAIAIATAIIAILVVLLVAPTQAYKLIPIILEKLSYLLSVTQTEYDDTFTPAVYEELLCYMYCNMEADGTFTDAGFQNFKNDLAGMSAEIPKNTFLLIAAVLGKGGMNYAVTIPATSEDCSGCDCEDYHLYIAYEFGEIVSHELGSNVWVLRSHAGSGRSDLYFRFSNENLSGDVNPDACLVVNPIVLTEDGLGSVSLYQWDCHTADPSLSGFVSYVSGDCQCQITIARTTTATPFEVTVTLGECAP